MSIDDAFDMDYVSPRKRAPPKKTPTKKTIKTVVKKGKKKNEGGSFITVDDGKGGKRVVKTSGDAGAQKPKGKTLKRNTIARRKPSHKLSDFSAREQYIIKNIRDGAGLKTVDIILEMEDVQAKAAGLLNWEAVAILVADAYGITITPKVSFKTPIPSKEPWARMNMNKIGGIYRVDSYNPVTDKVDEQSFNTEDAALEFLAMINRDGKVTDNSIRAAIIDRLTKTVTDTRDGLSKGIADHFQVQKQRKPFIVKVKANIDALLREQKIVKRGTHYFIPMICENCGAKITPPAQTVYAPTKMYVCDECYEEHIDPAGWGMKRKRVGAAVAANVKPASGGTVARFLSENGGDRSKLSEQSGMLMSADHTVAIITDDSAQRLKFIQDANPVSNHDEIPEQYLGAFDYIKVGKFHYSTKSVKMALKAIGSTNLNIFQWVPEVVTGGVLVISNKHNETATIVPYVSSSFSEESVISIKELPEDRNFTKSLGDKIFMGKGKKAQQGMADDFALLRFVARLGGSDQAVQVDDGIAHLELMDKSHVAMIKGKGVVPAILPNGEYCIDVDVTEDSKSALNNPDVVEYNDKEKYLAFRKNGKSKAYSFRFNTGLDPIEQEIPEPKIFFDYSSGIRADDFIDAVNDLSFDEHMAIENDGKILKISAEKDIEWEEDGITMRDKKIESREIMTHSNTNHRGGNAKVKTTFTTSYLKDYAKYLEESGTQDITLKLATDMPLKVETRMNEYYLAPCIGA